MSRPGAVTSRHALRGFTLIEVLIAITVTLLIVPLAVEGVRSGLGTAERLTQHRDAAGRASAAQRVLRKQISEALPVDDRNSNEAETVAFQGSNRELEFVARVPLHAGGGGLFRHRLRFVTQADRNALMLSYWPLTTGERGAPRDEEIVNVELATGIAGLKLAYFGSLRVGEKPDWHAQWQHQRDLPRRVRLQVQRQAGDARQWDELVIPVYAAAAVW